MRNSKLFTIFMLFACSTGLHAQYDLESTQNTLSYYSGTLGDSKIELSLQLTSENNRISGSYILEGINDYFHFNGRLSINREAFGVRVYNGNDEYVGAIEAHFLAEEGNLTKRITGYMTTPKPVSRIKIALRKQAEIVKEVDFTDQDINSTD